MKNDHRPVIPDSVRLPEITVNVVLVREPSPPAGEEPVEWMLVTTLPIDSPERMRLFLDMARQMQVDGAWQVSGSRLRNELLWPWVKGYKKHPILQAEWVYMDMAPRS